MRSARGGQAPTFGIRPQRGRLQENHHEAILGLFLTILTPF